MRTITDCPAARLYLDALAFPENDPLQKDPGQVGLPFASRGQSESLGHVLPLAAKSAAVIHWIEKPAGRPVPPLGAVTEISIDDCVDPAHAIVGVVIFGLPADASVLLRNRTAITAVAQARMAKASVSRLQYFLIVLLMIVLSPFRNRNVRLVKPITTGNSPGGAWGLGGADLNPK